MRKIIILILAIILLTGCVTVCKTESHYEYIDLFGNKGTSEHCYIPYEGGTLICELGIDSNVQVSEYKLIIEESNCD